MNDRESGIAAAHRPCPRCGAAREPDQRYCLECGLALPRVEGGVPAFRRRWIRRVGWYPGDWVWVSLLTLIVAAAGAAAAIFLTQRNDDKGSVFVAPTNNVTVAEPTVVPSAAPAPTTVDTRNLPTAPEPTTSTKKPKPKPRGPKNGRVAWPRNEKGWTIVLVSYPKTNGGPSAPQTAARGARAGLRRVGVLDSSRYASLQPGYYVVFA